MTISFSCKKIHISENSIELISHIAIVFFKTLAKAHQYKAFLVLNLIFLFLDENLRFDWYEGVDFKYDNSFPNSSPKIPS